MGARLDVVMHCERQLRIHSSRVLLPSNSFGLSVHMKLYPIIYSVAMLLYVDSDKRRSSPMATREGWRSNLLTSGRLTFFLVSALTFTTLTGWLWCLYGNTFLEEAYFYHFWRKDIRHSFSVYFYYLYLTSAAETQSFSSSSLVALLTFLPQFVLLAAFTIRYYKHIWFCMFVQTFTFVTFNKVCTVQVRTHVCVLVCMHVCVCVCVQYLRSPTLTAVSIAHIAVFCVVLCLVATDSSGVQVEILLERKFVVVLLVLFTGEQHRVSSFSHSCLFVVIRAMTNDATTAALAILRVRT